jgi:hypothetical protein
MSEKPHVLCFNCGSVTPEEGWGFFKYDDEGEKLVPVEEGDYDPFMLCPSCNWLHRDTDNNPGIMEGTQFEMHQKRRDALETHGDLWADANVS